MTDSAGGMNDNARCWTVMKMSLRSCRCMTNAAFDDDDYAAGLVMMMMVMMKGDGDDDSDNNTKHNNTHPDSTHNITHTTHIYSCFTLSCCPH